MPPKKQKLNTGLGNSSEPFEDEADEREPLGLEQRLPNDLLLNIASCFIATDLGRTFVTAEYVKLASTCKSLRRLLFGNPSAFGGAPGRWQAIPSTLGLPLDQSIVTDTGHKLSWRVCFETELCVLVYFRPGIVGEGVRFVAARAADMLEGMNTTVVDSFIATMLVDKGERFFGRLALLKRDELFERLRKGTLPLEQIMYVLQCMGFGVGNSNPELKQPVLWTRERGAQVRKPDPADKGNKTQSLGLMSGTARYSFPEIQEHTSALGRVKKVDSERTTGFGAIQDAPFNDLPFVGGPSGSSRAIMKIAIAAGLGTQSAELQKQVLLATVAFLVGGGQHSFDEVMHGLGDVVGPLGYSYGNYVKLLPRSLTDTKAWQKIVAKYGSKL
jgi:hypothetical protein